MTREHKLALIVGFSLVLLVGVLIADHLSLARRAQIAPVGEKELTVARGPVQLLNDPLLTSPSSLTSNQVAPPPAIQQGQQAAMPPQEPIQAPPIPPLMPEPQAQPPSEPAVAAAGNTNVPPAPPPGIDSALNEQVRLAGGSIEGGVIQLPLHAETAKVASSERGPKQPDVARPQAPVAPAGAGRTLAARPEAVQPTFNTYMVKKGDTLMKIAERTYGDAKLWSALAKFNGRPDGTVILGSTIKLPSKETLTGKSSPAAAPAGKAREIASPAKSQPPKKPDAAPTTPRRTELAVTYTVKKGDTLGDISYKTLGTSRRWREIAELNKLDDEDLIPAGTVLKVPPMRG